MDQDPDWVTGVGELARCDQTSVAPRPLRARHPLTAIINAIHEGILDVGGLSALVWEVRWHRALSNFANRKGRSDEMGYVHLHLHG